MPRASESSSVVPHQNLLVTIVMFGSAFASSKVVVEELPQEVAAVLRFRAGVLLISLVVLLRGRSRSLGPAVAPRVGLIGIVGVLSYNAFFF